jgi:hypothetical protein
VIALLAAAAAQAQEEKPKPRRRPPKAGDNLPVRQAPVVERIEPEQGPPGCEVTIHGQHFDETTRVRFNGRALAVVSRSASALKVRLPPTAVSDRFIVAKSGFTDVSSEHSFAVVRAPTIASFSPPRGAPGSEVTLGGTNFLRTDTFVLGERALKVVSTAIAPNRVVVQIPEGAGAGRFGVRRGGNVVAWSRASFEVTGQAPSITSFAPASGGKGTLVRIAGRNFVASDRVELEGVRLEVRSRSATQIEVVIGNHSSGRFKLVGAEGRRAEASASFRVLKPLTVSSFSPAFGPPGTRLTVEGTGFFEGDSVLIGSAQLTVRRIADSTIVAELPAGVQGGAVCVQRGGGKQRACARGRFEVLSGPAITNVKPPSAPPGATVTVSGRNFLPDTQVLLSGQRLPVKKRGADEIVVQIPQDARSGRLTVVTKVGSVQSPVLFNVTQYATLSSFFPLHALPGAQLTIRGAHFHAGLKAFLGELELAEVSRSERQLVVKIPEGAKAGLSAAIVLESYGKKVASTMRFAVDAEKPAIEFEVSPAAGRRGAEVTITVKPAREEVTVFFDGRPLPKRVMQGGRIVVVTIPSDARSGYFELELDGKRYRAKKIFKVR